MNAIVAVGKLGGVLSPSNFRDIVSLVHLI